MDSAGVKLKVMVKDPAMPAPLLALLDEAVDRVLPDVKAEAFVRATEVSQSFSSDSTVAPHTYATLPGLRSSAKASL